MDPMYTLSKQTHSRLEIEDQETLYKTTEMLKQHQIQGSSTKAVSAAARVVTGEPSAYCVISTVVNAVRKGIYSKCVLKIGAKSE
jgi:hypothetical protein